MSPFLPNIDVSIDLPNDECLEHDLLASVAVSSLSDFVG